MAFQAASPQTADAPPGIPQPTAAPIAAPTEMTRLLHMMTQLLHHLVAGQNANRPSVNTTPLAAPTEMTQLLHMMTQLFHHLVAGQKANLPSVNTTVSGTTKGLDERHFRCIQKFDNKHDSWMEWRTHFLTSVREPSPITAEVMEKAEISDVVVLPEEVLKTDPSYQ